MIPGWRRNVAISQAESAEDVVKSFNEMPTGVFMDFELHPLADWDESMKYAMEALKRAEQQSSVAVSIK